MGFHNNYYMYIHVHVPETMCALGHTHSLSEDVSEESISPLSGVGVQHAV